LNFKVFSEFLDGSHCGAIGRTKQQDLAVECSGCECFQHFADLDPACGQPKGDEIGPLCIERRAQLRDIPAFASDKPKFFEGFYEEGSNVLLAIGDANARPDLSPAKRDDVGRVFLALMTHECLPLH
jgi:hypothetical protein